jgi:tetratricopeptide (TPR) repeat protein
MKCPSCGAQSEGAFCSECGSPLRGAKCRECNAALSAGARFCNNCGAGTGRASGASEGGSKLPWIVAGASALVLVAALAWPALRGGGSNEPDGRVPLNQMGDVGTGAAGAAPGPLAGTPREQADRLFNRIMTERESGDTAQARFFVPMAVQAYAMAGDLDADGLYHLALVHQVGGDHKAARETAEKILALSPNHLLGLSAAANAARASGDDASARAYYQKFVQAFDTESKSPRPEYQDHERMFPDLKSEAENFLKGR